MGERDGRVQGWREGDRMDLFEFCVFIGPVGIRKNTPFRGLVRTTGDVDCKSP